jgi:hypothetical protein
VLRHDISRQKIEGDIDEKLLERTSENYRVSRAFVKPADNDT